MLENKLETMNNMRKSYIQKNKENWKTKCNERLQNIIAKKMTTLMIGSLDNIEKIFGDLWGHGKPETDFELECFKEWSILRQAILDLGNKQIRAIKKECEQYDIDWNRYQGIFGDKNENKIY